MVVMAPEALGSPLTVALGSAANLKSTTCCDAFWDYEIECFKRDSRQAYLL